MRRAVLAFMLMAAAAVALGVGALLILQSTLERTERLSEHYHQKRIEVEQLAGHSERASRAVRTFLLTGDEDVVPEYEATVQRIHDLIERLRWRSSDTPRLNALVEETAEAEQEVRVAAAHAMDARRAGRPAGEVEEITRNELQPRRDEQNRVLAELRDETAALVEEARTEGREATTRAAQALMLGLGAAVAVALAMGGILLRSAARDRRVRNELHKWRDVFTHTQTGVVTLDAETGTLLAVNPAFARMHGAAPDEMEGRPMREWLAPEGAEEAAQQLERAGQVTFHTFESLHRRADGSTFPALASVTTRRGPDGRLRYCIATVLDITGQKRIEAERQRLLEVARRAHVEAEEQGELLQRVIEHSREGVTVADERGRITLINEAAAQQHGVDSLAGAMERVRNALLDDEGRPLAAEDSPLLRAVRGEEVVEARWRVRRADGSVRRLTGAAVPLRHADGSPAGAVVTSRDETDRLTLERENRDTLARLDALVGSTPVGIGFLDTQLRYVRVNRTLAQINKMAPEEHLGRTPAQLFGEPGQTIEELLQGVLQTGVPLLDMELTIHWAGEAQQRTFLISYFPVKGSAGLLGVGGVVIDITVRKRFEEELRRTAEFRERFIGIVGHDLRNPLHAIRLSAQTLLQRGDLNEISRRSVERIASSGNRMTRMISELLDFTRSRLGGGIPIHPERSDVIALCREAVDEVELAHREERVVLHARGSGDGCWDAARLIQVMGNLLSNALRYSPAGSPVHVVIDAEGDEVEIAVQNGGEPIPPALLDALFDPFRRGNVQGASKSAREGLGLGLFIAEQIVKAHGGRLTVRSNSEEGTVFTLRLPRRPPPRQLLPEDLDEAETAEDLEGAEDADDASTPR